MMNRAHTRLMANKGLLDCQIIYASFAAVMAKEGADVLNKTIEQLRKDANNG